MKQISENRLRKLAGLSLLNESTKVKSYNFKQVFGFGMFSSGGESIRSKDTYDTKALQDTLGEPMEQNRSEMTWKIELSVETDDNLSQRKVYNVILTHYPRNKCLDLDIGQMVKTRKDFNIIKYCLRNILSPARL